VLSGPPGLRERLLCLAAAARVAACGRDRQLRVLMIRASHEGNRRAYGSPRVLKDR